MLCLKPEILKSQNKTASLSWVLKIWQLTRARQIFGTVLSGMVATSCETLQFQLTNLSCVLWWKPSTRKALKDWIVSMNCIPAVGITTTCWVTLNDTLVQFLGFLLKIHTVDKSHVPRSPGLFFFNWKEQQFPFFHVSRSFFHLEKAQHLDFPQLESSKGCLV